MTSLVLVGPEPNLKCVSCVGRKLTSEHYLPDVRILRWLMFSLAVVLEHNRQREVSISSECDGGEGRESLSEKVELGREGRERRRHRLQVVSVVCIV